MRSTRVKVLPVPGPAITATCGAAVSTAWRCASFRPWGVCASPCAASVSRASKGSSAIFCAFFARSLARCSRAASTGERPGRASCPSSMASSPGSNREISPYSPSNPPLRRTRPARRRRTPSAAAKPATRSISMGSASRRMCISSPNARRSEKYASCTRRLAAPAPREAESSSGKGTRLSNGFAPSGRAPSGRRASASTRCKTPMVSRRPHTGHTSPNLRASLGSRQTPQLRCPSRWYFPSSG